MLTEIMTIAADNTDALELRLAKLSKLAKKVGVQAPQVAYSNFLERETLTATGHKTGEFHVVCDATLSYEPIQFAGGWKLVASIESGELGNLVYSVNGKDHAHLRESKLTCEHCQIKRFRKVHYVLESETGEEKVIGSTCMKQFLGIDPKKALNFWNSIRSLVDDDQLKQGSGKNWFKLENLAAWVSRAVELDGRFVSRSTAFNSYEEQVATADSVNCNIALQGCPHTSKEQKLLVQPTEKSLETAKLVMKQLEKSLDKVTAQGISNSSDWDYKIANFVTQNFVPLYGKEYNIIVGAMGVALRNIDKENELNADNEDPVGLEYVDTLFAAKAGERVTFEGKVLKISEVENNFGYGASSSNMVIIKLGNKEKNIKVRFFTTKDLGFNEGDVVKMSVKAKNLNTHEKFGTTLNSNFPKVL